MRVIRDLLDSDLEKEDSNCEGFVDLVDMVVVVVAVVVAPDDDQTFHPIPIPTPIRSKENETLP